jgi:hypothetical protein
MPGHDRSWYLPAQQHDTELIKTRNKKNTKLLNYQAGYFRGFYTIHIS